MPLKFEDMWMVVIEQGVTAEAALDAIDGMTDGMTDGNIFSLQTGVLTSRHSVRPLLLNRLTLWLSTVIRVLA